MEDAGENECERLRRQRRRFQYDKPTLVYKIRANISTQLQTNKIYRGRDHLGTRLFSGPKYKGPFSVDYRDRGSHVLSVYPTHDTSCMEIARRHKNYSKIVRNMDAGKRDESLKQVLTLSKQMIRDTAIPISFFLFRRDN